MILRARTLLCLNRPPMDDGAVAVSGNRIRAVGAWRDLQSVSRRRVVDLGAVILMPGLINAHCHLDYTDMAGKLPPPKTFLDWIGLITAEKSGWGYSDYAQSWLNGAHMLLKSGVTTVADVGSGEFLGEMSLLTGSPRNATATATTDLGVLVSSANEFRSILRIAPTVADKVFQTSMERAATVALAPAIAA